MLMLRYADCWFFFLSLAKLYRGFFNENPTASTYPIESYPINWNMLTARVEYDSLR